MILVTEQRKLYFMLDSEDFCGTKLWMKAILSPATNTLMTPSKLESLEGSAFLCCHFCVILWNTALFVREREDNKWKLPLFKKEVRSKFFNPGIVSRGKKKTKTKKQVLYHIFWAISICPLGSAEFICFWHDLIAIQPFNLPFLF